MAGYRYLKALDLESQQEIIDFYLAPNTLTDTCKKFNKEDIKRQYRDARYPFNCDFYIKPLDTFIELNIHWTHGPHKFDKNNLDDIKFLNYWQNKATTINGYNDAIKVWTTKDPLKFKVATKNNLIYKVFYTLEEALNWLKEIN